MPFTVLLCRRCKKQRRVPSTTKPGGFACMKCVLKYNKPFLLQAFNSIIAQPEMSEFKRMMERWYV